MELSKRSLKEGSKILIIDDFLRGGGTVTGLERMAEEFNCEVVDSMVFLEHNSKVSVENYHSLLRVKSVNEEENTIEVETGNFLSH